MPDLTRTGHAKRMTNGNRPAVDVVFRVVDFQSIAAVEALGGKRFVELPQVDISDLQTLGLEQLRHREHRADAHFIRAQPATVKPRKKALGLSPNSRAFSRLITRVIDAPSDSCDELPAVTEPSSANTGFKPARLCSVVSG